MTSVGLNFIENFTLQKLDLHKKQKQIYIDQ